MQKITLGTTYYNCPDLLERFLQKHSKYVDELIVVDDGSKKQNCISKYSDVDNNVKLYRVHKDLGFNSHGCRNLIASEASNNWIVLIDIDREFDNPEYTFNTLSTRKLKENVRYLFITHYRKLSNDTHASVNDFLIHRNHYFSVGGYDEELVGQRWGDREFLDQLKVMGGKESLLYDIDLIATRNASLLPRVRHKVVWKTAERSHFKLMEQRAKKPDPNKPILQFEWDRLS